MISLNKPIKPCLETLNTYLRKINESGHYTNFGPMHSELTDKLEKYLGVENLLLVSNGTIALQVAYKVLGIKNSITTPFSFIATTSTLKWEGIKSSYCDINKNSFNICPKSILNLVNNNRDIDSIVATHVYGNPCDISAIDKIAEESNLKVIYDAAHAFGVDYKEKSILSYGDASTVSFHATKLFHTVEGGAIIFKNRNDYKKAKKIINFGMDKAGKIAHIGLNAKLNEYQCAVGLTILNNFEEVLSKRVGLYKAYVNNISEKVQLQDWNENSTLNGAYFPIVLKDQKQLERVCSNLTINNIGYRRYFYPSLCEVFKPEYPSDTKNSKDISSRILCLPLHYYMDISEVEKVCRKVNEVII